MGWQTESVVQLIAGNTIINPNGMFTYSGPPGTGNLSSTQAPTSGTDSFGNHYLSGVSSYGATVATSMVAGALQFYTGSLAGGWSLQGELVTDVLGDLVSTFTGTLSLSGNLTAGDVTCSTINGSPNTGAGSNGGVTSGPSGTVSAFPAAGPNHTHAEAHTHPV
jgi:hypothetical protein